MPTAPAFAIAVSKRGAGLDISVCYSYNTPDQEVEAMFEDPVAKRTAIAAAIGAVIAIPVPFVGPLFGAVVGAGVGYLTAKK
jgi:hypothetical protein